MSEPKSIQGDSEPEAVNCPFCGKKDQVYVFSHRNTQTRKTALAQRRRSHEISGELNREVIRLFVHGPVVGECGQ